MQNQHEIKNSNYLLDKDGNLNEPGWARSFKPIYNRNQVGTSWFRLKEWDYYIITNGKIGVALTIADNGYMGLDGISFLNFKENWEVTKNMMRWLPKGRTHLPQSSKKGNVKVESSNYGIKFINDGNFRTLSFWMDNFKDEQKIEGEIHLTNEPKDSIVISTPFKKDKHFYYNQKINCMDASGSVKLGSIEYKINESFKATLDWGRGVWTYHNTWYWGSASGEIGGVPLGWNLGYGFGDTSAASENVIFYNGKAHKLNQIKFSIPDGPKGHETEFLKQWKITSNDGRFEMDFKPIMDRVSLTDFKILKSDQHQVFGHFSGKLVLDDGTEIRVKDFFGFAEKVENKW